MLVKILNSLSPLRARAADPAPPERPLELRKELAGSRDNRTRSACSLNSKPSQAQPRQTSNITLPLTNEFRAEINIQWKQIEWKQIERCWKS